MDSNSVPRLANAQNLSDQIQLNVDSLAGRHIDLTSIDVIIDTASQIDPVFIIINIVVIIIIILLTIIAAKIADKMLLNYVPRVAERGKVKMDETMQLIIRRLTSATIYILGAMLVILQIPQLHSLATALLAGAGIAGLAIGFAAKDSLSNVTSGIFIALFQPFRVGDYVDFKGDYGQIEDLTLRHTVIRIWDNRRIIVPNSAMNTEPIINWSIREPEITWTVEFDLEKASDIDQARDIILEKARSHPMVLKERGINVFLMNSRYSELTLRLEIAVPGRNVAKSIGCDIREAVKKEFEAKGIPPAPTP
jgi:small conductance mechanosensitive channel